jgi:hypothetical protein
MKPLSAQDSVAEDAVEDSVASMPVTTLDQPVGVAVVQAEGTRISVVMPTTGYGGPFERCARRVLETLEPGRGDEFIVVFDGAPPPTPAWLAESAAVIVATGRRGGPAGARNHAAELATGDVLLFVDADVEPAADAVGRVRAAFDADPDLCGVFGAYDAAPAAPGLVSRFRNLLHHHTHLRHAGPAETFWAGCGAIRANAFADLGGFNARYRQPSIEDIELGVRAVAAGGRLRLDPAISCTHHKRWTLGSMIMTDVWQRAVPWTRLMLDAKRMPKRLNLDWTSRVSGACAVAAAAAAAGGVFLPWALVPAIGCLAVMFSLNRGFYALCRKQGGVAFAAGSFLLHWIYFTYATLAFAATTMLHHARREPAAAR